MRAWKRPYTLGGRGLAETKVNGDFIQSPTIWRRRDAKVRGNEITVNNIRSVRVKKREGEK